jgi:hypothetical protein
MKFGGVHHAKSDAKLDLSQRPEGGATRTLSMRKTGAGRENTDPDHRFKKGWQ